MEKSSYNSRILTTDINPSPCKLNYKTFDLNLETNYSLFQIQAHINYEVQLQRTLLYHPMAVGEDSMPGSKLVFVENGTRVFKLRTGLRRPASCQVTGNERVSRS
ncbi:hypothetical protein TNCV_2827091 [Trichonephila clavipes]|nr:hypothetical protein TNCV_2827091 [Trichonephila clavipes]